MESHEEHSLQRLNGADSSGNAESRKLSTSPPNYMSVGTPLAS